MAKMVKHDNEAFNSDARDSGIKLVNLSETMRTSFLDYSMSVIVSRALPDVKDGFKPVHRRIIYSMNDAKITYNTPHKKSARIVGDVMGKYHPHGDSAIYLAMVRLAQDFSYRYPLVDGHGNFGSIDGDEPAAMRYTEARMSKIANELVRDIDKNTVDFMPNYDGEDQEPIVLPCRIPNLLINGSTGIAVGMATNIPTHNLNEVIDATLALAEDPEITCEEIMKYVPGPDFPTGGIVLGRQGIKEAYETGSGSITIRGKAHIEDEDGERKKIIITEIPYGVNKSIMVEGIHQLSVDKKIEGIATVRDESNMEGIRVVVELKKEAVPEVVLNQLYKMSKLQASFGINMLAVFEGQPKIFTLKEILQHYIDHQIDVIKRKTTFDLEKAKERQHIVEGLKIAGDNIDEVVEIIRHSKSTEDATEKLAARFGLSDKQIKAILDMKLQRLVGIEQSKLDEEIAQLIKDIELYNEILANHSKVIEVLKQDMLDIKNKYGDERRTLISDSDASLEDEDLIPVEDIIITLTQKGYIKRVTADTYKTQNRGGKGIKGMTTNDKDYVDRLLYTSTHSDVLFFSSFGRIYRLRAHRVPEFSRVGKGIPAINILSIAQEERIVAMTSVSSYNPEESLFFVTKQGVIKKVSLKEFENINKNGKIALSLKEGDELLDVKKTCGNEIISIASSEGKVCSFNETDVRQMGRTAAGVKGITLSDGCEVVGVSTQNEGKYIFVLTEHGYGKMSEATEYRITKRGGKGVATIKTTDKNGKLVCMRNVNGDEDLIVTTDKGVLIRTYMEQIKIAGRSTMGVKVIRVSDNQKVATIAVVEHQDEEEVEENVGETQPE